MCSWLREGLQGNYPEGSSRIPPRDHEAILDERVYRNHHLYTPDDLMSRGRGEGIVIHLYKWNELLPNKPFSP